MKLPNLKLRESLNHFHIFSKGISSLGELNSCHFVQKQKTKSNILGAERYQRIIEHSIAENIILLLASRRQTPAKHENKGWLAQGIYVELG